MANHGFWCLCLCHFCILIASMIDFCTRNWSLQIGNEWIRKFDLDGKTWTGNSIAWNSKVMILDLTDFHVILAVLYREVVIKIIKLSPIIFALPICCHSLDHKFPNELLFKWPLWLSELSATVASPLYIFYEIEQHMFL